MARDSCDPQGRLPKVSRAYETSGNSFTTAIAWDRHFGDGTLAPIGMYDVVVKAFDRAGNMERVTAHILIPLPGVTPTPLPTRTPIPMATATATLPVSSSLSLPAQPAPTATRAPTIQSFQSPAVPIPQSSNLPSTAPNSSSSVPPSSFPLWGAAAAAAIGAATAYALEQRRKQKEEEARQLAEAQAEAARRNAAEEALKVRNWLMGQAMVRNALSHSGLSQAEQERVRAEACTKGVSAALGLLDSLKQAAQARLAASWKAMENKLQQAEKALEQRLQPQAHVTWDAAKWKERDYAESARWQAQQQAKTDGYIVQAKRTEDYNTGARTPPIGGLIAAGILLTLATFVLEIPLTWGEFILAGPAFAGNPLAVAGELLLMGASAFLVNFDIAYWAYVYRVSFAPAGMEVKLNMKPFDWGLIK